MMWDRWRARYHFCALYAARAGMMLSVAQLPQKSQAVPVDPNPLIHPAPGPSTQTILSSSTHSLMCTWKAMWLLGTFFQGHYGGEQDSRRKLWVSLSHNQTMEIKENNEMKWMQTLRSLVQLMRLETFIKFNFIRTILEDIWGLQTELLPCIFQNGSFKT